MAYAILRTHKLKTWGNVGGVGAHHARTRPTANADPKRTGQNLWLAGSGDPAADVRRCIEQSGARIRKNGVLAVELVLTASPEWFRPDEPERAGHYLRHRLEAFNQRAMAWLRDYFGPENVISAVCHLDEATPHIQAIVVPLDPDSGRLNAARWLDGSHRLAAMQDSFAAAVEPLELERGIRGSEAEHTRISQFYGVMNADPPVKIPKPKVQTPPAMIREASRQSWAEEETQRITLAQLPSAQRLADKAQVQALSERKRRGAEATAKTQQAEVEEARRQARELADRVRDLDLEQVAEALALERDHHDRAKWHSEGMAISLTGTKFYDHQQGKGGGGAIDLAMHVLQANFKTAVSWLAGRFGEGAAAAAVAARAEETVRNARQTAPEPFCAPVAASQHWSLVRSYLTAQRGLDADLVDWLHDTGRLYADGRANCVFIARTKDVPHLAEKRGTDPDRPWRGLQAGSDVRRGGFRLRRSQYDPEHTSLVLVESAIDAISYYQLHPEGDYLVISTCGAKPEPAFLARHPGPVVCAYDADEIGDRVYEQLRERRSTVTRERPKGGKDWNEILRPLPAPQSALASTPSSQLRPWPEGDDYGPADSGLKP